MAIKFKKRPVIEIPGKKKKKKVREVSVETARVQDEDSVQIAMTRTLENPTVGKWKCEEDLGKKKLKQGKSYYVPINVAHHFKDIDACVIVGEDSDDDDEEEE
jgi:D-lyxose ketol-isomerase